MTASRACTCPLKRLKGVKGRETSTHFSKEPSDNVAEDNCLIGLVIIGRGGDSSQVPKIRLPLVQSVIARPSVKQEDSGSTFDKPSTIDELDASFSHGGDRIGERGSGGSKYQHHPDRETCEWEIDVRTRWQGVAKQNVKG